MAAGVASPLLGGDRAGATRALVPTADAWPRTRRPLPWLIAAFLTLLVLFPFDSVQLPVSAPIDPTMDRLFIGGIVLLAVVLLGASSAVGPEWRRLGVAGVAIGALLLVVAASDVVNLQRLEDSGETTIALKRYGYLVGYASLFAIVAWSLRPQDVRGLLVLLVALGVLCALGVIYQYRAGANLFYEWTRAAVGGALLVDPTPAQKYSYSRPVITGPTQHGLAVATMLLMIAPFALGFAFQARERRGAALWGVAFVVIVFGSSSTLRRTSVLALVALMLVVVLYRPGVLKRLLPFGVPVYLLGQIVAPGVGGSLRQQLLGNNANSEASTEGRASDYPAILPDVLDGPLLGRGFGTYTPDAYRVLDNQWLLLLLEVGAIGVLTFVGVLIAAGYNGHLLRDHRDPFVAWFGVAGVAAVAAFGASCVLYDALGFAQPTYMFMALAGMLVVLRTGERGPGHAAPTPSSRSLRAGTPA